MCLESFNLLKRATFFGYEIGLNAVAALTHKLALTALVSISSILDHRAFSQKVQIDKQICRFACFKLRCVYSNSV